MNTKDTRESTANLLHTVKHLRKALDGSSLWLDTIVLPHTYIKACFETNLANSRQATVFFVLAMSLGDILDKKGLQLIDFVRAVAIVTQEVEVFAAKDALPQAPTLTYARREKTRKSLFSRAGVDFNLLHIPHLPFVPDYLEALQGLLDILHEILTKLITNLNYTNQGGADLSLAMVDANLKFNTRVRKILHTIHKDMEQIARQRIHLELGSVMADLLRP